MAEDGTGDDGVAYEYEANEQGGSQDYYGDGKDQTQFGVCDHYIDRSVSSLRTI